MVGADFDRDVERHTQEYLDALKAYCRQPCITGQGIGIRESAQLTADILRRVGCDDVRILETEGAPVVFGQIGTGEPTLLIYNHYDVQPPEPIDQWDSDPFGAEEREGKIYCRGIADNRGDVMARVQAIESYLRVNGELPLTIKFIIEGEEEIGSPSLPGFIDAHRELLAADGCLWEGGALDEHDRPIITLGLKGVLHAELRVRSSRIDMHSSWATIVPTAPWRLAWALASLKSPDDRIQVDGLMDQVRRPTEAEVEQLEQIPFDEEQMKADLEIPAFIRHLDGVDLLKKHLFEPTCTIQGLSSGYSGPGLKAVLPNEAMAKIEFRLVPDLDPDLVLNLLRQHLDRRGFEDVEIIVHAQLSPAKARPDASVVWAAVESARQIFADEPVIYPVMAASGPMSFFSRDLAVPVVTAGGLWWPEAQVHAPNENLRVEDYVNGIKYIGRLIDLFAERAA